MPAMDGSMCAYLAAVSNEEGTNGTTERACVFDVCMSGLMQGSGRAYVSLNVKVHGLPVRLSVCVHMPGMMQAHTAGHA